MNKSREAIRGKRDVTLTVLKSLLGLGVALLIVLLGNVVGAQESSDPLEGIPVTVANNGINGADNIYLDDAGTFTDTKSPQSLTLEDVDGDRAEFLNGDEGNSYIFFENRFSIQVLDNIEVVKDSERVGLSPKLPGLKVVGSENITPDPKGVEAISVERGIGDGDELTISNIDENYQVASDASITIIDEGEDGEVRRTQGALRNGTNANFSLNNGVLKIQVLDYPLALTGGDNYVNSDQSVSVLSSEGIEPTTENTNGEGPESTIEETTPVENATPDDTNCPNATTVDIFEGSGINTTPTFATRGDSFRITSEVSSEDPDFSIFQIFVNDSSGELVTIVSQEDLGTETSFVNEGPGEYFLEFNTANVDYSVTVDDCAGQDSGGGGGNSNSDREDSVMDGTYDANKTLANTGGATVGLVGLNPVSAVLIPSGALLVVFGVGAGLWLRRNGLAERE